MVKKLFLFVVIVLAYPFVLYAEETTAVPVATAQGFWEAVLAQLVPLCAVLITTLLSAVLLRLQSWLKKKGLSEQLMFATDAVFSSVSEIGATMVKELKDASADGKLTKEEITTVKNAALTRIKQTVPNTTQVAISQGVADFEKWAQGKIEEAVKETKEAPPPSN